jgi:hypothetical protein
MLLTVLLAFAAQAAAPAAPAVTLPEGQALHDAVAARSAEFFTLYHEGCDPERLRAMLMPGFEMYHDQNGVSAGSAAPFVARYAERCPRRRTPGGPRLRRALLADTLTIHPVPGYGAIEEGTHEYYGSVCGRPERKVTTARYLGLWALTPEGWRLARAFSFGHRDEPRMAPIPPGECAAGAAR